MHDVVIVGAGPAGLSTAYHLRRSGLDVAILEAGDEVGGRTRTVTVGGLPSNTGALFVYRDTTAEELATEFDIATVPFVPDTYGIHINGSTVVDTDNDRLISRLPISELARRQLRGFINTALLEYAHHTTGGKLADAAADLGSQTIAGRLEGLEPDVVDIVSAAIRGGSAAEPDELSAQYALRYFASYLAREKHNRLYPVGGMQQIPRALAAHLPDGTITFGATVQLVTVDDQGRSYTLHLQDQTVVRARQVVMAIPAPSAHQVVADLPAWKTQALSVARMPGSTTLCITADVTGLDDVAQWSFVATPGRVFDAMINPWPWTPGDPPRSTVQFVCYSSTAGYRPDLADSPAATAAWTEEFLQVAPQLRNRVLGAHLQTWQYCFAILTPERAQALEALQRSIGGLHFAGDHTSATAGTHGAYGEGRRIADLILSTA